MIASLENISIKKSSNWQTKREKLPAKQNLHIWHVMLLQDDPIFSHTFAEKIEKSMNLLIVCKLYPESLKLYLALIARLLVQDKKSTRHNSNVSSQINRFMVLQAGSSHATTAESLNSRLLNVLNCEKKHKKTSIIVVFRNVLVQLTSLLVWRTLQYVAKGKPQCRAKWIVNIMFY